MDRPTTPPLCRTAAPAMQVPFFRHGLGPADSTKIAAVLATPYLTSGQLGRQVDAQLCDLFGVAGAKLTNSWINGAVAVLMALGIGPGDEVIVPAMTFIATASMRLPRSFPSMPPRMSPAAREARSFPMIQTSWRPCARPSCTA